MSAFEKPQIIAHIQKGLNYTVFDCKWVPCSAKFVTMGNFARGTGVIQLYEIQHGDLKLLREVGARSRLPSSRMWECRWGRVRILGVLHSFRPMPSSSVPQKRSLSCAGMAKSIAERGVRRKRFRSSPEFSAGSLIRALPALSPRALSPARGLWE